MRQAAKPSTSLKMKINYRAGLISFYNGILKILIIHVITLCKSRS